MERVDISFANNQGIYFSDYVIIIIQFNSLFIYVLSSTAGG
jgi:hypothetical protein